MELLNEKKNLEKIFLGLFSEIGFAQHSERGTQKGEGLVCLGIKGISCQGWGFRVHLLKLPVHFYYFSNCN